ncbi:unnamed protein product [Caenorhabditis auriculariae]|uniref:Acyl carrier protein n=1 Tax=Caenorhabditis auriculariae TaxID=2777116 RepID=A0A8S1I001_9PELO|nr:unnamed protein product [Caenorhabditis auriculariae]
MFVRRFVALTSRAASVAAVSQRMASSSASPMKLARLSVVPNTIVQKRGSKVSEFGPFDPPKKLTFKEVEERLIKAVRAWDRFPADKESALKLDANFSKDLGFDSLDQVEIVMSLEDEFGFEIPLQDSDKFQTVRDAFKYICEREDVYE